MQGKLFFREIPEQDGKQWMAFGVVALPAGRFAAEHGYFGRILPYTPLQVGINPQQCTPPQSMMDEPEELLAAEIHDVMKAVKWLRSTMDGGGRMILRGCPVTPPEGYECFILSTCLALEARPEWRGEHLYTLQNGRLTDPQDKMVQALGSQPGQILQRPWWGFGPEPVGLTSTMALETLQQLDALDYLHDLPEAERREVLSGQQDIFGQPRFGFTFLNKDPDFNRFRQAMRANGVRTDWLKPRTFDDLDVRNRVAREVMDNLYPDASLAKARQRRWQQVMAALRQDAARLKARHPDLLRVFVFGSFARGDWHGDSDVDVLCLVQDRDARRVFSGADFPAVTEGLELAMDVLEVARHEWGPLADRPDWQPIMRDLIEVLDD